MAKDKLFCLIGPGSQTVKWRGQKGSSQSLLLEFYDPLCVHHSVKSWLNVLLRAENASSDYIILHKVRQSKIYG